MKTPRESSGRFSFTWLIVPKISGRRILSISENGAPTKTWAEHFKINDLVKAFANFAQGNQTIGIVSVLTTRPGDRMSFQLLTIPARYDPRTIQELYPRRRFRIALKLCKGTEFVAV
ncbi:hypothetical protein [Pseudomonas sp. RIT288]|uniref:hypothetical protein n=1 Tax=Pseudomonas sp. RIT288 TaxID=1470589 RepID=UPI0006465735|nr:hypothetical protein [Pseudomonas sp. RIT288]